MPTTLRNASLLALAAALASCNGGSGDGLNTAGCTAVLRPSADDQTAFQMAFVDAQDDADICVAPGTYTFNASVAMATRTGVTFRGLGAEPGDVVLDFQHMTADERAISFTNMTDVTVQNMTILDATHDDLYFKSCHGVTVEHVVAGWVNRPQHGAYAIYPVESEDVRLDHCEAYGSADAGLYVGQTTNCIVSNSLVHDNVAGLEIENSTNCEVFGNTAENNTAGILVFELPGLLHRGMTTSVHDNISRNNNHMNFAAGGIVQYVPVGLGIMVMGAHEIEVHGNTLSGNGTTGILLVSYDTAVVAGADPSMDATYDGRLRHVYVHDNTMMANSRDPDPAVGGLAQLDGTVEVDVLWDEVTPADNVPPQLCIASSGNFRSIDVGGGFADPPSDTIPAEAAACMTPVIPAVVLGQ